MHKTRFLIQHQSVFCLFELINKKYTITHMPPKMNANVTKITNDRIAGFPVGTNISIGADSFVARITQSHFASDKQSHGA